MKDISKGQIMKLRTLASKRFDDEEYHDWLFDVFGKESTKDLKSWEAHQAIKYFETGKFPQKKNNTHYRSSFAHKGQLTRIALLQLYLEWEDIDLFEFIKKQVKRTDQPTNLKKDEAVKVIIGLQQVLADGSKQLYNWINRMGNKELNLPENLNIFNIMRNGK